MKQKSFLILNSREGKKKSKNENDTYFISFLSKENEQGPLRKEKWGQEVVKDELKKIEAGFRYGNQLTWRSRIILERKILVLTEE